MIVTLPPLHAGQKAIARSTARTVVAVCGRRWGKTLVCLCLAVIAASEGRNVLWIGPVHRTIAMVWRRAHILLAPLVRAGMVSFSESNMTITFAHARIDFRSAEAGDNLRGDGNYALIVCDEAASVPERTWFEVILPMKLDAPNSRVVLAGTPKSRDDFFARAYRKGVEGAPGFESFTFPSASNPHLDRVELENAREDMSPTAYAREIEAQFVADDSVLFPTLVRGPSPECKTIALGADLAISQKTSADHTCIVVAGTAADKTTWILHAERGHWTMRDTCERIALTAKTWGASTVAVEKVAYQAAAVDELERMPELSDLTINGVVPKGDKVSRAAPMSSRVASGAIRFADTLPDWYVAEMTGFPLARRDDAVDATQLAYAAIDDAANSWLARWDRALAPPSLQAEIAYLQRMTGRRA